MKRTNAPQPKTKKLSLKREAIKVLDDDALTQTRGAGAFSTSKFQQNHLLADPN